MANTRPGGASSSNLNFHLIGRSRQLVETLPQPEARRYSQSPTTVEDAFRSSYPSGNSHGSGQRSLPTSAENLSQISFRKHEPNNTYGHHIRQNTNLLLFGSQSSSKPSFYQGEGYQTRKKRSRREKTSGAVVYYQETMNKKDA